MEGSEVLPTQYSFISAFIINPLSAWCAPGAEVSKHQGYRREQARWRHFLSSIELATQ